jgi:hypothetical protein
VAVAAGFALGFTQAGWGALGNSIVQFASPDSLRGRVLGVHVLVTRGFDALSALQAGLLVSLLGPPLAVTLAACALGITLVTTLARAPGLRAFTDRDDA